MENTKRKNKKRSATAVMAAALLLSALAFGGQSAQAAMPTGTTGYANDGVDFAALSAPGSGVYYGAYDHAAELAYESVGEVSAREGNRTPILWRAMGEEAGDGYITALSEYVLDTAVFRENWQASDANVYEASEIKTFLSNMATDADNFPLAEQSGMAAVNVVTGMYDCDTGAPMTGSQQGTTYPVPSALQKLYLPYGGYTDNPVDGDKVYWEAGNTRGAAYELAPLYAPATLKSSGTGVFYWLRSPLSGSSALVLEVADIYGVLSGFTENALGVRPAFKLDPASVIFASEIGVTDTKYVAGNYKLTVLNAALLGGAMTANSTAAFDGSSAHPAIAAAHGGSVSVSAASATADTKLTYKIVDSAHNIVGYGQSADNAALTVNAKDLAGANLAAGNYTVYVWAQKDNAVNSHEGSAPQWFTLTVNAPPYYPPTSPAPSPEPSTAPTTEPTGEPAPTPTEEPTPTPTPGVIVVPGRPDVPPPAQNPGAALIADDGGGFVELGEDGTPLGAWHFDEALEAWIFDPIVPLGEP
ncbi:MAG: hypothetical protein LBT12_04255, partial [Oscillospiraceae bacterium]|nr:hypothetical protein [Oscillospiraceae bacterium]